LNRIAVVIKKFPPLVSASAHAVSAILIFTIGAVLENRLQLIFEDDPAQKLQGFIWIVLMVVLSIMYGWVHYLIRQILKANEEEQAARRRSLHDAREKLVGINQKYLTKCDSLIENKHFISEEIFRETLICDQNRLQQLVEAIWDVINSHHNSSADELERINFEVTLITPSRRDSHLTIAAWKNRDMRRPRSLAKREMNPSLYEDSEAAKIIKAGSVSTEIIEDTSRPEVNYAQYYRDQRLRIRSCVLHPIISPAHKHLGVLVLHCDRPGFFKKEDQRYWSEFFAIFSSTVGLELERIEAFNRAIHFEDKPMIFKRYSPY
jgi:GAF domain-containing protein